jgi:hypothetical protein
VERTLDGKAHAQIVVCEPRYDYPAEKKFALLLAMELVGFD